MQATDGTYNQTKHMQNSVRWGNVQKNQTQHIQNSLQNTTLTKSCTEHF